MMRRSLVLLALLLASGCARDPQRVAARFIASGDRYVEQKRFKEAQIEYRNALEARPQDVDTQLKLARVYEQGNDVAGAYRSYLRAARLDPRRIDAQLWLASFMLQGGRFDDARRHATAALNADARNVRALIVLASADAALRDRASALKWVQEALAIDPASAAAHTMLGALHVTGGDRARAREAFVKATELAPASDEAWTALAEFHIAIGEFGQAENALKRALAVTSNKIAVHRMLGTFYVGVGRAADAERHLQIVADAGAPGRLLLADYYAATNRREKALELLERIVADRSADRGTIGLAHLRRAAIWHAMGDRTRAHAELAPLFKDDAIGADAHVLEAQFIMREEGDLSEALKHAREAVSRRPNDASLQYVQGTVYLARRELAEAETSLRRARDLAPAAAQVELQLARVSLARGDYQKAIEGAKRVVAASPSVDAVALLAEATRLSGDIASARNIISSALKRQADDSRLYIELGEIELAAHRADAARTAFERSLSAATAVTADSITARARRGLIAAELAAGRTAAADARVARWMTESPAAADIPILAAAVHLAAGNAAGALADYERAARANPQSAGIYTAIGMLKSERGDRKGAQAAYERALELEPNSGVAANNLAWIYADERRDDAVRLAQTAQRALGGLPSALDTLGWMYYLKDSSEEAVAYLEKAVTATPSNAVYRYHLGAALVKANQAVRGRRELQRALALSSTFDGAADAKRLLEAAR
jgi:tetratricopeptide (TPR) repeat protein